MTQNKGLKMAFAVLFAVIILLLWTFGHSPYVFAADKKQKGGSSMASSEDQATTGTASGYISLNGSKINLNYAYALAQPNTFDEEKLDIALLLTENPVSEGELKDIEGLEFVAHKKHNYALFKINDQGKPITNINIHTCALSP